ncbi:unnamed protein product [Orchesella dallaii]|uniref:Dipeptidyl peptidase 9 n=1 Tax=Orchesella dallaii TaxID=48710 RepID=A0ABP1PYA7_9HEXA
MKTETEQSFSSNQVKPERADSSTSDSNSDVYTPWLRTKRSWAELRDDVRDIRRRLWNLGSRVPHSFTFRKMLGKTRVYFMSSPPNSRDNSVFAIEVPDECPPISGPSKPDLRFPWIQIIASDFQGCTPPSKEELLMMERKRMTPTGISSYEFHEETAKFVFGASTFLYQCIDNNRDYPLTPTEIKTPNSYGARLNAEICPANANLIAYVNNGDLWVVNSSTGSEVQLTFTKTSDGGIENDPISAGFPSYIMQEEFNRFQGFWWQPNCDMQNGHVYRILYEEVDESDVNLVSLLTLPGRDPETYRFPVPGSPNAMSALKFVNFEIDDNGGISNVVRYDFMYPIQKLFSWVEYIVRAGWTPDGKYIYAQLLNRQQQRLELVLIPYIPLQAIEGEKVDDFEWPSAPAYVLYSEQTNVWINVHDILSFFPSGDSNSVMFLWASEESGFRHLYIVKSELRPALSATWKKETSPALCLSPNVLLKAPLTSGDWEVMNAQTACNYELGLIFFIGLKDSPIERHLYVVSVHAPKKIRRLTPMGCSYTAYFNADCTLIILTYSSTKLPPVCQLYRVKYNDATVFGISLELITHLNESPQIESDFSFPEITTHQLSTGENLYAMIYKPFNFQPNKRYPTILNVYGGPEVQLVYNSFRGTGQFWLYLLASQGYCVVAIDSRGSHHRGVQFEGHIRGKMGTVELKDQVEVLRSLAWKHQYIDMDRVGIYGWSYGGYLSLMGLIQYPQLFKVAVAGAPVTSWELYDTGYTERYMDLPSKNPAGYKQGSVLTYINQFPDEEDRLLIVHGLNDENVHFIHTAELLNCLLRAGKPYQLQLYPNERHSLRKLEASEHYETTFLSFLQRRL